VPWAREAVTPKVRLDMVTARIKSVFNRRKPILLVNLAADR
jgi:hypothetical protein